MQLHALHEAVLKTADENKINLIPTQAQDFFQLDASYIRVKNDVIILLHVPCTTKNSLLNIYRYAKLPYPIDIIPPLLFKIIPHASLTHTVRDVIQLQPNLTTNANEAMYIIPDADLIAIGRNTLNGHQYKLLSSSELQSCTQRNHVYLCEQHQILRNDLEGSCLGALYLQSARGVRENCRLERRELRETVYQLSANDHIVISPQTLVTQIQCNNGSHYPIKLEKMSKIHVPPACTVALRNHTISADTNIRIAPEPLQFHWEFDFLDLPSEMLNTAGHIDDQMNSVKIALGLLQLDAVKEHEFENIQ